MKNQAKYRELMNELEEQALSGSRIYTMDPYDVSLHDGVIKHRAFFIRSKLDNTVLLEAAELLKVDKRFNAGSREILMQRLCDSLKEQSTTNPNVPFESRFEGWPRSPFERWMSDTHQGSALYATSEFEAHTFNYNINIAVYSTSTLPYDDFKEQYGSALTMTKMTA